MARLWDTVPSDFISFPNNSSNDFDAPVSWCCWYKGTSDTNQRLWCLSEGATSDDKFYIELGPVTASLTDELITIRYQTNGGTVSTLGYTTATRAELFDGNWHHICLTSDNSAWEIYLDGDSKTVTVGGGSNTGEYGRPNDDTTYLGARRVTNNDQDFLNGAAVAELAIWNVKITGNEIKSLHAGTVPRRIRPTSLTAYYPLYGTEGFVPDFSGNGNTGTPTGTTGVDHAPVGRFQPRTRKTSPFFAPSAALFRIPQTGSMNGLGTGGPFYKDAFA